VKAKCSFKSSTGSFHKAPHDRNRSGAHPRAGAFRARHFRSARPRLKLRTHTSEGRRVRDTRSSGSAPATARPQERVCPVVQYPENKVDPDMARRLELWEKQETGSRVGHAGHRCADAVPLGCDSATPLQRSRDGDVPAAELDLPFRARDFERGGSRAEDAAVRARDEACPHAVKDPLRFLGKAPAAPAARPRPKRRTTTKKKPLRSAEPGRAGSGGMRAFHGDVIRANAARKQDLSI